jgi:hypothetical protein
MNKILTNEEYRIFLIDICNGYYQYWLNLYPSQVDFIFIQLMNYTFITDTMIKDLISNNLDINKRFNFDSKNKNITPLCYTSKYRFSSEIQILLENGADIYIKHNNYNVLELVLNGMKDSCVKDIEDCIKILDNHECEKIIKSSIFIKKYFGSNYIQEYLRSCEIV